MGGALRSRLQPKLTEIDPLFPGLNERGTRNLANMDRVAARCTAANRGLTSTAIEHDCNVVAPFV